MWNVITKGSANRPPTAGDEVGRTTGEIACREHLGALLCYYYRKAAWASSIHHTPAQKRALIVCIAVCYSRATKVGPELLVFASFWNPERVPPKSVERVPPFWPQPEKRCEFDRRRSKFTLHDALAVQGVKQRSQSW